MTYADLEKGRECHGALREIFIHHPGGWADRDALLRVQKLAWQAMTAVNDPDCHEQLAMVERYAGALYSDAQHHNWRMSSLPGADFLRLQILRALVAFNSRLGSLEAARHYEVERPIDPAMPPN
jgi:hypothetical protein